jgi:membrane-associated phospholipid phosphatase
MPACAWFTGGVGNFGFDGVQRKSTRPPVTVRPGSRIGCADWPGRGGSPWPWTSPPVLLVSVDGPLPTRSAAPRGPVNGRRRYRVLFAAVAGDRHCGGHCRRRSRQAAGQGVLAIALASTATNLILKPLARRKRPARSDGRPVPDSRRVRRPASASFPSGHAASAFAFASAMGHAARAARLPLRVAAATVAYSRVHTGVHYPSDVAIGAVIGDLCG